MARDPDRTRRNALAVVALVMSSLLAGGAVFAVAQVLTAYQSTLADALRGDVEVQVPVAARTLGAGTVITPEDLEMVSIGEEYLPDSALLQVEHLVGRTVLERLLAGDLVRYERLAPAEAGQGLSALVPRGMRALSLDLADGEQVSGFIEPGDGVDLLVTLPVDKSDQRAAETITLVQGVRVLAVNERISETVSGEQIRRPRVTLAVSPDVVERITHALEVGAPKLTLRSAIDTTSAETHGAVVSDLLGADADRVTVSEFRARFTEADVERMIEIILGRDKVRERVVDPHLVRAVPRAR